MGVELGKVLAKAILAQLNKPEDVTGHDSSVRQFQDHQLLVINTDTVIGSRQRVLSITIRNIGRSDLRWQWESFNCICTLERRKGFEYRAVSVPSNSTCVSTYLCINSRSFLSIHLLTLGYERSAVEFA